MGPGLGYDSTPGAEPTCAAGEVVSQVHGGCEAGQDHRGLRALLDPSLLARACQCGRASQRIHGDPPSARGVRLTQWSFGKAARLTRAVWDLEPCLLFPYSRSLARSGRGASVGIRTLGPRRVRRHPGTLGKAAILAKPLRRLEPRLMPVSQVRRPGGGGGRRGNLSPGRQATQAGC